MRIAIVGGGVIGLIYAVALARANHEVVIRSRGARARLLADKGVAMAEMGAEPLLVHPTTVDALPDGLDWVLVAVRPGQLEAAVAQVLEADSNVPILTLSNAPRGLADLRTRSGGRLVAGFPGVGGYFDAEGVLRYVHIPDQPTTLEGGRASSVAALVHTLERAGFPATLEPRMDDWLRTHAVFICALGGAMVQAGCCEALAADRRSVADMIAGVREGFQALSAMRVTVRPFKLPLIFSCMPRIVSAPFWARKLTTPAFTVGLAPHVLNAVAEMADMAHEVRAVLAPANTPMPHLEAVLILLEERAERVPIGMTGQSPCNDRLPCPAVSDCRLFNHEDNKGP